MDPRAARWITNTSRYNETPILEGRRVLKRDRWLARFIHFNRQYPCDKLINIQNEGPKREILVITAHIECDLLLSFKPL